MMGVVMDLAIADVVNDENNTIEGDDVEERFWSMKAILHEDMIDFVRVT